VDYWRKQLENDFTTFSNRRGIYYQIRYPLRLCLNAKKRYCASL